LISNEVTLPQLINFVDKQGREIRPLRVTSLQKGVCQPTLLVFCVVALLIFKLCLNISKATNQVTLPQLINFVDKQSREIRPLRVTSLPKSQSILLIGLPIN
jgi:uncharacterized protein YciW